MMKLIPIYPEDAENIVSIMGDNERRVQEKELDYVAGNITECEIECYRKHLKYLKSLNKKLINILNQHLPKIGS